MNLLMLSGDTSVVEGRDSTFYRMLARFSTHWDRIDIFVPRPAKIERRQVHGNVYFHPGDTHKLLHPRFLAIEGEKLLAERDYALIVSHDYGLFLNGNGAWRISRSTGVPYVSEIHHIEGYPRTVSWREWVYRWLALRYLSWVRGRAAAIRTVNRTQIPNLLRRMGVPEEKILYLPSMYIDFDVFCPRPEIEKRYDVLFVGRLAENKGLLMLVDALAQVRETHPKLRACFLGQGPMYGRVVARMEVRGLLDNIQIFTHANRAEDVAQLYNEARMLVCASTAEGGPRVTIEAMACGTPVISTRVGVMEDVIHDGENGLLVDWSVDDLATKIRLLLDDADLRMKMGEAGRVAVQGFDAETVIARYAQGYKDLIARLNPSKGD